MRSIPSPPLTPRQWQILELMGTGLDKPAVAAALGISYHALRAHLYGTFGRIGLYERLDADSDVQAVVWWWQYGQHQRPAWDARGGE